MSRFSLALLVVLVMFLFSKPILANGRPLSNTNQQETPSVSMDATSVSKSAEEVMMGNDQVLESDVEFPMASGPSRKGSGH
ncbi:hypothetical protein JCGZ_12466 [Jatropha curcas]|uniref:Uncharacterized protein n=1 Tax=Jatropha curcas TaxID=180498 RepID=A0A067KIA3_JATCU|nr:hypothetical protein JCGZ_12466 [Jatropha curcas]